MFNNTDVMDRVNQYGIAAVPMAVNDGKLVKDDCSQFQGSILCLDQFDIDSLISIPSIFDLRVSLAKSSSNATINVIATAKTDIPLTGLKLFTVLIEDTIDYAGVPPGSNGEYEFTQVMRNFLPDINGESLPTLINNQSVAFNYNYVIPSDIDPTMLKAVTFVQDISKGTIYQSANSDFMTGIDENKKEVRIKISPNPANDFINVEMENSIIGISKMEIYDLLGNKVSSNNINTNTTTKISIAGLSMGIYICRISNNGKIYKTEKLSIIK
jgi:hypothetical protein